MGCGIIGSLRGVFFWFSNLARRGADGSALRVSIWKPYKYHSPARDRTAGGKRGSPPSISRMRVAVFSSTTWLCLALVPAPSAGTASHASSTARTRFQTPAGREGPPKSTGALARSGATGQGEQKEEMTSTALDFREMMRKERERAMKKLETETAPPKARYLSKRRTRIDLDGNHRVASTGQGRGIDGIFYVPEFITRAEGRALEKATRSGGGGGGGAGEWKDLHKRRLQIHGGIPHPSGMVEEDLPVFLQEVCDALVDAGVFPESSPPNHVLLNEYSEGQGIGPHKDGPLYEGRVAILSLGKEVFLDFWGSLEDAQADCAAIATGAADGSAAGAAVAAGAGGSAAPEKRQAASRALASVWCEDGSLVVFEGQAYHDAWHGIASTAGNGGGAAAPAAPAAATTTAGRAEPTAEAKGPAWDGGSGCTGDEHASGDTVRTEAAAAGDRGGGSQTRLSFTIRRVARVLPPDSVMEHSEARSEMERRRRGFERSVTDTGLATDAPTVQH